MKGAILKYISSELSSPKETQEIPSVINRYRQGRNQLKFMKEAK